MVVLHFEEDCCTLTLEVLCGCRLRSEIEPSATTVAVGMV